MNDILPRENLFAGAPLKKRGRKEGVRRPGAQESYAFHRVYSPLMKKRGGGKGVRETHFPMRACPGPQGKSKKGKSTFVQQGGNNLVGGKKKKYKKRSPCTPTPPVATSFSRNKV